MPSHESSTPTLADANDALFVALVDVCEKSFFTCVESCDASRFASLIDGAASTGGDGHAREGTTAGPPGWLKASVAFAARFRSAGQFRRPGRSHSGQSFDGTLSRGAIDLFLPEPLAQWLVASLLGVAGEVELGRVQLLDEQVFDGIGEFANMLCGAWLTDLAANLAFALSPPAVSRLPADWRPAHTANHNVCGHHLCVNDLPMQVLIRTS